MFGDMGGARIVRPRVVLTLTDGERESLGRWSGRRRSSQALALRCRIVLARAEGLSNKDVVARLGVSLPTVGKWRRRFLGRRLDGLSDEPRSGKPATVMTGRSRT